MSLPSYEELNIDLSSRYNPDIVKKYNYTKYENDPRIIMSNNFKFIPKNLLTYDEKEIWVRCKIDPLFFIENFVYIQVKELGNDRVEFGRVIQPRQREYIELLYKYGEVIVLKTRQMGFSIQTLSYILWMALFNVEKRIGIIQHKAKLQSKHIDVNLKTMMKYITPFLMKEVSTNNVQQIKFKDNDMQQTEISAEQPGQGSEPFSGETIDFLMVDEQQKIPYIESHMSSMLPSMQTTLNRTYLEQLKSPTGYVIISTPKKVSGRGKWFYDEWMAQKSQKQNNTNDSSLYPITQFWYEMGKTQEWYEEQKKRLKDKWRIQQELDGQFVAEEGAYFDPDRTIMLKPVAPKDKLEFNNEYLDTSQYLSIWQHPIEGNVYVIGVDIQERFGVDFSAIEVIDGITGQQVQEWRGKVETIQLAMMIAQVQNFYNQQLVGVEANKGFTIIEILRDVIKYPKLFQEEKRNSNGIIVEKKYGIRVTSANRKVIIDEIQLILEAYNADNLLIVSDSLIDEITSFKMINGRPDHKQGQHDDLLFQFAYQLYVRTQSMGNILKYRQTNEDFRSKWQEEQRKFRQLQTNLFYDRK